MLTRIKDIIQLKKSRRSNPTQKFTYISMKTRYFSKNDKCAYTNREYMSKYNELDKKMRLISLSKNIYSVYNEFCQLFSVINDK